MKITDIKQQVRRQGRYSVFVDDKYAFSFSENGLLERGITIGQELDEVQLKELKQASADDKVYNNALAYALLRPRSRWEMEQYLKRKHCSPPLADQILNKLSDIDLLDDEKFARSWVANRRLLKATSRRRLLQELRAKRVPDTIAQNAVGDDETDERQVLTEIIARKRKQSRYQDEEKLMQYLSRQGFSYGDIKSALESGSAEF
jgi:regulatory protein